MDIKKRPLLTTMDPDRQQARNTKLLPDTPFYQESPAVTGCERFFMCSDRNILPRQETGDISRKTEVPW